MQVTFLLLEGYSNFVLACLLEPLRMLRERYRHDVGWRIVTVNDSQVSSSSGLTLTPTHRIGEMDHREMLVIVSSNGFREHVLPENQRLVRALVRHSEIVVGADAGAWLLASTAVLDNLSATVHWTVADEFAETFPQVRLSHDPFVMDGKFWSCGGATTGLDLMLAFIAQRYGAAKAFAISSMFTHETGYSRKEPETALLQAGRMKSRLDPVLDIMIAAIETPLTLPEIAAQANMSLRTLNRIFKSELAMPPKQYYQGLRLARAQELAETTTLELGEIALRCGYGSAPALCKAFRQVYGHPIRKPPDMSAAVPEHANSTRIRINIDQ